jgi:hypothetical protein
MKKIPTVFQRDPADRAHVLPSVNPGCEWVLAGEGTATVKLDGTCTMLDEDGRWWARREVKPGKTPPQGWVQVDADEVTGKRVGWEPIAQSPYAKAHAEALPRHERMHPGNRPPGTYELVGPKVNGNPHGYEEHTLERHGVIEQLGVPRDFEGMRAFLLDALPAGDRGYIEGIVWHHPDGRMAKLKIRDFA